MKTYSITFSLPAAKCRECEIADRVQTLVDNFDVFRQYGRLLELVLEQGQNDNLTKSRETILLLVELYQTQLDWYLHECEIPLRRLSDLVENQPSDSQQHTYC